MADKPIPEEELPPTQRFERLANSPEPDAIHSVRPDDSGSKDSDEPAEDESKDGSAEPQSPEDDAQSVLERFDALKERLAGAPVAPPPAPARSAPPTPADPTDPSPNRPALGSRADEALQDEPQRGALDERISSAQREGWATAADLQAEAAPPLEPDPDVPTSDDLEQINTGEAKKRRRAARKAKRKAKRENRSFWKELPALIVVSIVVAIVIKTFFFQAFYIPSASMVPTLEVNDRVLVNKLSYQFGAIERGDILVFDSPEAIDVERSFVQRVVRRVGEATGLVSPDTVLIKRVIGLPGQTIEIRDGQMYVNDSPIAEPYLAEGITTRDFDPLTVPADHVFMMGDNRNQSRDSRVFGPIPKDEIVGRAFVRVWPVSRWDGL